MNDLGKLRKTPAPLTWATTSAKRPSTVSIFDYILPTQAGWDFGRRSVFCSLHRLDGTRMTGNVPVFS
jgi:hypothetical protein